MSWGGGRVSSGGAQTLMKLNQIEFRLSLVDRETPGGVRRSRGYQALVYA